MQWHHVGGVWIVEEAFETIERKGSLFYDLHPAVFDEGSGPGYALILHSEGDPEVLATWWSPGPPDYVDEDWLESDPDAQRILAKAEEEMAPDVADEMWNPLICLRTI